MKPNMYMDRKQQAALLRITRKVHRIMGAFLFAFFIVGACTALLLGWKKNSDGKLLPDTMVSREPVRGNHVSLVEVQQVARAAIETTRPGLNTAVDRMDIRPEEGIVKVLFRDHYWEVQVDLYGGNVLQVDERHSDFIENLHDGSILDRYFPAFDGYLKLVYTSTMGMALLTFSLTGFWLWCGPKVMRQQRGRHPQGG